MSNNYSTQVETQSNTYSKNIVTNLVATILTNHFKIPIIYYGAIIELLNILYNFISNIFYNTNEHPTYNMSSFISIFTGNDIMTWNTLYMAIQVCILLYITYYVLNKFYKVIMFYLYNSFYYNKKIIQYKNYIGSYINISDITQMKIVSLYILNNNLYIDKNISHINIYNGLYDSRLKLISPYKDVLELHIPSISTPLYFEDSLNNVCGYIMWKTISMKEYITENETYMNGINSKNNDNDNDKNTSQNILKKFVEVKTTVPQMLIYLTKGDATKYMKIIEKDYNYNPNTVVKTTYYATNQFSKVLDIITNKEKDTIYKKRKEQFIDTFFHIHKEAMWSMIYKVHFDQEYFIQRGQYPQISLCLYGPPGTGKSSFAYRIAKTLQRNIVEINLMSIKYRSELQTIFMDTYVDYRGNKLKSCDTVFVLDEFDIAIQYMYAKEQMKNKMRKEFMDNTLDFINTMKEIVGDSDSQCDDDKKTKTTTTPKLNDKPVIDNSLTIDDLLSILQGPCANNGSIIIATTNKYHIIKDICPRLFRDGRLKPYHFGYPTKKLINEICCYYFEKSVYNNKDFDFLDDNEELCISQSKILYTIVNLLLTTNNNKQQAYKLFIDFINNQYKNKNQENLSFEMFDT